MLLCHFQSKSVDSTSHSLGIFKSIRIPELNYLLIKLVHYQINYTKCWSGFLLLWEIWKFISFFRQSYNIHYALNFKTHWFFHLNSLLGIIITPSSINFSVSSFINFKWYRCIIYFHTTISIPRVWFPTPTCWIPALFITVWAWICPVNCLTNLPFTIRVYWKMS